MRLPHGMTIFTAESHPHSDGNVYCIDFLANNMEHAKKLAEVFGFNIAAGRFGTLEAVVEKTPDGLLTDWDCDVESLRAQLAAAEKRITWGCACGRVYLAVDGITVAVEGERSHDSTFEVWNADQIKALAAKPATIVDVVDRPDLGDGASEQVYRKPAPERGQMSSELRAKMDRSKLIDVINEWFTAPSKPRTYVLADRILALFAAQGWRNVSDPPDSDRWVLMMFPPPLNHSPTIGRYSPQAKEWHHGGAWSTDLVTHWHELPTPPSHAPPATAKLPIPHCGYGPDEFPAPPVPGEKPTPAAKPDDTKTCHFEGGPLNGEVKNLPPNTWNYECLDDTRVHAYRCIRRFAHPEGRWVMVYQEPQPTPDPLARAVTVGDMLRLADLMEKYLVRPTSLLIRDIFTPPQGAEHVE